MARAEPGSSATPFLSPSRRKALTTAGRAAFAVAMAAAGAVAGCAAWRPPRTIEVPRHRLEEIVAAPFPMRRRWLDVFELSIAPPLLDLQPDRNRIAADFAVAATGPPGLLPATSGSLRVSHALRYEPGDRTVRATDVDVERFSLEGLPAALQGRIDRFGRPLAAALLEGRVLYALQPRDVAALDRGGVRPSEIRVTPSGIAIDLVPDR